MKDFEKKFDVGLVREIVCILIFVFCGIYFMEEVWIENMSGVLYAVGLWAIISRKNERSKNNNPEK